MLTSRASVAETPVRARDFGESDRVSFWEERFLTGWLPLLLGLVLGTAAAFLIFAQAWIFLLPVALIVPLTILFVRYPFTAVILWLLVFPYVVDVPSLRILYTVLYRAMIPGTLGIVILSDWLRIRKREPVRFGRAELIMLVFLGLGVANIILLSPERLASLIHFYDRLFVPFCMYCLVRLSAPSEQDMRHLLWVAFITIIIQACIGFLSVFTPEKLPEYWLRQGGERTMGSLGNPAVYTSTLLFLSLLLFQYAMQGKSRLLRPIFILTFGLTCLCVFLSFSRGSWLGGLILLVGLIFVYPKVLRYVTAFLLLFVLLGGSIFARQIAFAWERLNTVETAEERILGDARSLGMIQAKPLTGWGYDTYDLYDDQFRTRVGNLSGNQKVTSHNTYLSVMAEQGVPALLLYLFPTLWWLLLTLKVWRRMPKKGFMSWPLLALLWLLILDHFVVSNFMDMIRFNLFGTTIYWMALGIIASMVYPYLESGDIAAPKWTLQPARSD